MINNSMLDMAAELEAIRKRVADLERIEKLYIPAWDDFIVQIGQSRLPASAAPNVVSYLGSEVLSFSKTATNTVTFTAQIPHAYKAGSAIEFHVHVVYPNAGAGNSRWQCSYNWANIDAEFDATSTTSTAVTIASPNTARRHQVIELVETIAGTGKTLSSMLLCSVSRLGGDGADDYDDVIYMIGVDFHIQRDAIGSRAERVK